MKLGNLKIKSKETYCMSDFSQTHKPTEIRVKQDKKILEVDFADGSSFRLPAELLRVESPSAEVQGHSPSQKKVVSGAEKKCVWVTESESIGPSDVQKSVRGRRGLRSGFGIACRRC